MSKRMMLTQTPTGPELLDLLERAKTIPITPRMRAAQRRSWVTGEMMLAHPDMTKAEADRRYDDMLKRMGTP